MGGQRRHAVEREPAQERPRAVLQRAQEQDTGVLALQRSAGNRAVAEHLQVARDDTAVPTDTETEKGAATLKLEGIGSFEIDGFSWGSTASPGSGTGGAGRVELTEVRIVTKKSQLGSAVSTLAKAVADGRKIEKADIVKGSFSVHLHDVYITHWQTGPDTGDQAISFTLDFGSVDYGDKDKTAQGTPDSPRWDPGAGAGG